MRSAKRVGRTIGLLFLAQLLLAPPLYFRLLRPVTGSGFLANAAGSAGQIRVALLLVVVLGALTLSIPIVAMPLLRRHSERLALLYVALGVIGFSTLAMDNAGIRAMLFLSEEYVKVGAATELLQALARAARSTWISAHFTNLMVAHASGFVMYGILHRFALVPRALAAVGMAATLVSTMAVSMPLLGLPFPFVSLVPVGMIQLALIGWLLVRGLAERPSLLAGPAPDHAGS